MDTVVLDGVEYVKASEVAKRFRYTSDYVGQLCRGKKVDARLVGRTWFVNPLSIVDHRKTKYIKPTSEESETNVIRSNDKPETVHISVTPVIKNKTVKAIAERSIESPLKEQRRLRVSYERDDETLFPDITKIKLPPKKIVRIEQADAKKIRVAGARRVVDFTPDELPDVALSGKLSIIPLPEADESTEVVAKDENNYINIDKTEDASEHRTYAKIKPKVISMKDSQMPPAINKRVNHANFNIEKVESSVAPIVADNTQNPGGEGQMAPSSKRSLVVRRVNEVKFAPASVEEVQVVRISTAVLLSPLIATVLALVVVTMLFSASSSVVVSDSSYQSEVILQVANLLEILRQ